MKYLKFLDNSDDIIFGNRVAIVNVFGEVLISSCDVEFEPKLFFQNGDRSELLKNKYVTVIVQLNDDTDLKKFEKDYIECELDHMEVVAYGKSFTVKPFNPHSNDVCGYYICNDSDSDHITGVHFSINANLFHLDD